LKIYDRTTYLDKLIGNNQFSTVPLQIYIKTHFDTGWASDRSFGDLSPRMNDTLLYGAGFGLDFVTFYDAVIRFEYTINHFKEHGFYLHLGTAF